MPIKVFADALERVKLFVDNRRDGSRLLSSAVVISCIGLIRFDTTWGQILFVAAASLSLWWWLCYRKLTH